ncbi:uncharacterized protein LOC108737188 [Agrilus planipennis]|uniref:Uncharacterized protein LOC108737188 n=1 Tax=Agrilus planipennis TaxID=224129 RepID=A0A1W4WZB2_AGRPL|nr:uncharacterized protein LOC108737188 [Agrilus planipennis]
MSKAMMVSVNVRRYDLIENPSITFAELELNETMDYNLIKGEIKKQLNISDELTIKVRNGRNVLLPLSNLIQGSNSSNGSFFLDILKIHHNVPTVKRSIHLQDAYLDAIKQKVHSVESRLAHAEQLVPQLRWHHQTRIEETVHNLSTKVSFLDRRIDELMPAQWKTHTI